MTELELSLKKLAEQMAADNKRIAEQAAADTRELKRVASETSRELKEMCKRMDERDRRMDKLNTNIGGISNSNGEFAEEYFFNSLERQMTFAGIHFDDVSKDLKNFVKKPGGKKLEDEFDIVMFNKKSVALIEIKYKAKEKYIEDLVNRKIKNFKTLFPKYKNYNIYLGLGSLSFDKKTIEKAEKYGVGLLKQVGETIEYKANWKVKAY